MGQLQLKTNVYQAVKQAQNLPNATAAQRENLVHTAIMADDVVDPQEQQLLEAMEQGVDVTIVAPLQAPFKVTASSVPFVDDEGIDAPDEGQAAPEIELAPALKDILAGKSQMKDEQEGPAVREVAALLRKAGYEAPDSDKYAEIKPLISAFQVKYGVVREGSPYQGLVGKQTLSTLKQAAEVGGMNTKVGQDLAAYARRRTGGRTYSTKSCYLYVATAVGAKGGVTLTGRHAYMAANQLARSSKFKEIQVAPQDLPKLPAGAVVVWGKGSSKSGHISIADGKGNEISDFVGRQMTSHYGGAKPRVFLPI